MPLAGSWYVIPEPPSAPRAEHAATWTGDHLVIWGGVTSCGRPLNDGVAYDPRSDSWIEIEQGPLAERGAASAVWVDDRLVIWGGFARVDSPIEDGMSALGDGACYVLSEKLWQHIPRAPVDPRGNSLCFNFAGSAYFWGGRGAGGTALNDGARFDPRTSRWCALAGCPLPPRPVQQRVWVDDKVIVWGSSREDLQTEGSLSATPRVSSLPRNALTKQAAPASEVVADTVVAYEAAADAWQYMPTPEGLPAVAWTLASQNAVFLMTPTGAGYWWMLPNPPRRMRDVLPHPHPSLKAVALGDRVVVLGSEQDRAARLSAVWCDRESRGWHRLPESPLTSRHDFSATAVGTGIIVWGGVEDATGAVARDGAFLCFPDRSG